MNSRPIVCAAALVAVALLGGCAVYPAYPAYPAYTTGQVVNGNPPAMAPAPVYVAPAPVYYSGPVFYPSISIFGRFGGGGGRHWRH